jgi:hypothetical protein
MADRIPTPSCATSEAEETYLTPIELSERFRGLHLRTLSNWRCGHGKAGGPPFIKAGGKVLYPRSKLIAWEDARLRAFGSNEPPEAA